MYPIGTQASLPQLGPVLQIHARVNVDCEILGAPEKLRWRI